MFVETVKTSIKNGIVINIVYVLYLKIFYT